MNAQLDEQQPVFSHVEPVLPVPDIDATIKYWQEVLAFPNKWTWGDPPMHGGVSWHTANLQFHLNAERAKASAGNVVWIRVKYIDQLYDIHQKRNAEIDEPLTTRSWGTDEYIVKDLNGYYIVFSGHSAERKNSTSFPKNVVIVERRPTHEEFIALQYSVGWSNTLNMSRLEEHLSVPVMSVVAIDTTTNETIGCALVISDNASFYYIKDVMVKKEWQGKRIGTALMKSVSDWLEKNGVKNSLVGLYTGENLEPFYSQFGLTRAFGMIKRI